MFIDLKSAAMLLCLSPGELAAMARNGQVPHSVLPGGFMRFDREELLRWARGLGVGPAVRPAAMEISTRRRPFPAP